jgi:DNA-binding XRE family transcriptional regulator
VFDYSKLRGRIIEKFGSQSVFAKKIGLSERSLSKKMNNKVYFNQLEMEHSAKLLGIRIEDIPKYFFVH